MASGDILFLREGELIVGPKVTGTNAAIEPVDARVFRTRISFEVGQDKKSNVNKAKIMVYNLSEDSRTFLEQDNLVCFLKVGYRGTGLTTLFFGDIDDENGIHVERNGADIITTIQAGDAEKTVRDSIVNIGFAQGATSEQVITEAVKQLNVSLSYRSQIPVHTFQNGYSFSGTARRALDEMARLLDFEWSIQNGELLILTPGETDQQEAIALGPRTGLIGYPTKTLNKVEFKSLLNPKIRPGRAVRLDSQIFLEGSGADVKVTKTSFKGDTHEGDWFVKVEGEIQ